MREELNAEELAQYAIEGDDDRFAEAVGKGTPAAGALVSIKASADGKKRIEAEAALYKRNKGRGKREGKGSKPGSNKKRRQ